MSVAMMQPYLFPYLGYFQLVNAVDVFVFADDVNFIKGGFINRNRILLKNEEYFITVPCAKKSQNKLIKEIHISNRFKGYPEGILLTIRHAYKKAPFFDDIFPIIEAIFNAGIDNISTLSAYSVETVSRYLEINVNFKFSSISFGHTKGQEKSTRLINITKELGSTNYINPVGGKDIYCREYFDSQGVKLDFLESEVIPYTQLNGNFIPNLSIIDVLMYNSLEDVNKLLTKYRLI